MSSTQILKFKPSVGSYQSLPITNNCEADLRFVRDTGDIYLWVQMGHSGDRSCWKNITKQIKTIINTEYNCGYFAD